MASSTPPSQAQLRALARLYRTRSGRELLSEHGPAIISLMFGAPSGRAQQ